MEYGKFASAEELLKGYNELEKSFTQKCQQLAELKNQLNGTNTQMQCGTNEASSPQQNGADCAAAAEDVARAVPADANASPAADDGNAPTTITLPKIIKGGNVSMAAPSRPKTIKEASLMAKELFGGV